MNTIRLSRLNARMAQIGAVLPGLILCAMMAMAAEALGTWIQNSLHAPINSVIVVVVLGLIIGNVVRLPTSFEAGIRFCVKPMLRLAIILLGFQLAAGEVLAIGVPGLLMVAALVISTLLLGIALGRLLGLSDGLGVMLAVGTSICGASAIVAVQGVIRGRQQDVTCALAIITLLGTAAMIAYPWFAMSTQLDHMIFAAWAGTSIHEVAQVVAAGFAIDNHTGLMASVFKLTRVLLLVPACIIIAIWWAHRNPASEKTRHGTGVPAFIWLFALAVVVNSVFPLNPQIQDAIAGLDHWLIVIAMAGLGLQTHLKALKRLGWRPAAVGVLTSLWLGMSSFFIAAWIL